MKIINYLLLILFLVGGFSCSLFAQNTSLTTGGNIESTGGSVSYSIGQIFYTSQETTDYLAVQGVQQPVEISVITSAQSLTNPLELSVFPNPIFERVVIKNDDRRDNLVAHLFDSNGKCLSSQALTADQTYLELHDLSPSIYFIRITQQGTFVQSFKLIKR